MAIISQLQQFAADHNFGITTPLKSKQVVALAKHWLPQIFFFEQERFHPITLDEQISMVQNGFGELPDSEKNHWRVNLFVRTGENTGATRAFNPPVLYITDGSVSVEGFPPDSKFPVRRVLNDSISITDAFELPEASGAVISHGASLSRSEKFFGGETTVKGGEVAAGNPLKPRATTKAVDEAGKPIVDENGVQMEWPLITVFASFKNLLETLEYELLIEEHNAQATEAAQKYPPDALRGGFDIADILIFPSSGNPSQFNADERRKILLALIAAEKANEPIAKILEGLPPNWEFNEGAWRALTRYVFLEYEFFYAYNDFERVQATYFDNEHEGDNEGCCLVFDRRHINAAVQGDDPEDPKSLLLVVPESIITSVHEEWQKADKFQLIPQLFSPPNDPKELRNLVNLAVYVAWGSHATYLTPGEHPLVDFQDITSFVGVNTLLLLLLASPKFLLVLLILVLLFDKLEDPHDVTSEDGIHSVPEETIDTAEDSLAVRTRVTVLPMSKDDHIYQPEHRDLLRLRSFAGLWGGHHDLVNHSPKFETKTGRYFRKLLQNL